MKRKLKTGLLLLVICFGCHSNTKTLKFYHFTIEVPPAWKSVDQKGIDSYVGGIALDKKDTVYFDLGWYSNDLKEEDSYFVENGRVHVLNEKKSTEHNDVYDYYGDADTVDLDKFHKNRVSQIIIDNRKAKLVQPKIPGKGTYGIYIDSLWMAGSDKDKFVINGRNLSPANEKLFLAALKTLKFNYKE